MNQYCPLVPLSPLLSWDEGFRSITCQPNALFFFFYENEIKCWVPCRYSKHTSFFPPSFLVHKIIIQPGSLFIFWPKREAKMFLIHHTGGQWTGVRNVYMWQAAKKLEVSTACNSRNGRLLQEGDLSLRHHSGAFFIFLPLLWKSPL